MNRVPDEASAVNRTRAIICELAVACEDPVNPRPTPAPRAVTPAQAAHRPVACEDSTSVLAVAIGWKADNMYSLRVLRLSTQRGHRETMPHNRWRIDRKAIDPIFQDCLESKTVDFKRLWAGIGPADNPLGEHACVQHEHLAQRKALSFAWGEYLLTEQYFPIQFEELAHQINFVRR